MLKAGVGVDDIPVLFGKLGTDNSTLLGAAKSL
jgi:hypothetical protein